ncbi:(s)-2,3-di-O-geranylgeranylglyceryl phosphate synthase [Methanocaldococcus bathoardescens]|uniref:Digeranylgeranylglyceryl phosphate synthase n=1 Tax=Methanocaldococcus bathoardescens TaxID=1301915 RepID=A0A076LE70_9EURY|nr:UbiA family prenyltransferase [Methanocaldococcus bathoardescens]AIJ05082.1 (s)-2,3-di-O-geranylgeranylglyceryl phosphate synthase [Methanocaldococcus bathoardescens]
MRKIGSYLELIRVKNCITASIGGIIGYLISSNFEIEILKGLLVFFVVFFVCAYGNVINDIFDIEIDKINKPFRPLPSGKIKLNEAKKFSAILLIFGLTLSIFINIYTLIIAVVNAIFLYLYAKKYKRYKPIGNFIIGYLTGSVFLFGGVAGKNVMPVIILFLCSLLSIWGREIVKDFEDMEGDKKEGVISLPIKYGKKSLYFATFLVILAVVLSPLPYILKIFGIYYLILIAICDILFIYAMALLLKSPNRDTASNVSKFLKIIMNIVLLAFIVGAIKL